jgi:hypothetical protein
MYSSVTGFIAIHIARSHASTQAWLLHAAWERPMARTLHAKLVTTKIISCATVIFHCPQKKVKHGQYTLLDNTWDKMTSFLRAEFESGHRE